MPLLIRKLPQLISLFFAAGHGAADMDVEHMMLGPEGVIPCAKNLLERAQSVTFKTEVRTRFP